MAVLTTNVRTVYACGCSTNRAVAPQVVELGKVGRMVDGGATIELTLICSCRECMNGGANAAAIRGE